MANRQKRDRPELKRIVLKDGNILWAHSKSSPARGHRWAEAVAPPDAFEGFPAPSDFSEGMYNLRGEYVIPKRR